LVLNLLNIILFQEMRSVFLPALFLVMLIHAGQATVFAQESDTISPFDTIAAYPVDTSYFTKESDGFNLIQAAERGDLTAMEILLRRGADVTETTWDGVTALMYAAAASDLEAVKMLHFHGAGLNSEPLNGMTALIGAVRAGSYPVTEFLLENGADPDHVDKDGLNALMYAVAYNYYDIVDLLLYHGADMTHKDWFRADAMIIGSYYGSFESVKMLIDYGADIETTDKYGFTPLIVASQEGHYELVWMLLEEGADIHDKNSGGYDALSIATLNGRKDVVQLLIDSGANVNSANSGTMNVIDIAKAQHQNEIAEFLKLNGARRNFFPALSAIAGGFEINWNWNDVMIGPGFGLIDRKYGLELYSQFLFRPVRLRVLEEEGEELAWQFWERRFMLTASLNKNFGLYEKGKAKFGCTPGVGMGYTWGSFRGSDRHPAPRTLLIPNVGLYYEAENFVCNISYQYADLKVNKISPHHFNISFRFIIDMSNKKYMKKEISWF
jgi:ankyrin repeat protein